MSRWLRTFQPRPNAPLRLVCVHHAGGAASTYRPWADLVPATLEVTAAQLPGREERGGEAPFDRMAPVADGLAEALSDAADRPMALFGHSMGAYVAVEVARRLQGTNAAPVHVFVSGAIAPHLRPGPGNSPPDDDALIAELRRLNGTPAEVFEREQLLRRVLRIMRADVALLDDYRSDAAELQVGCPLSALGGLDDEDAPVDSMGAWAAYTSGTFGQRTFAGDHFFVSSAARAVVPSVVADLVGHLQLR